MDPAVIAARAANAGLSGTPTSPPADCGEDPGHSPAQWTHIVCDALRLGQSPATAGVAAALSEAARLTWSAFTLADAVVGRVACVARAHVPVRLSALVAEATACVAAVAPLDGHWATRFAAAWGESLRWCAPGTGVRDSATWKPQDAGRRLAPLSLLTIFAAEAGGRADLCARLGPLLDETAGVQSGLAMLRRHALDADAGVADPADDEGPAPAWRVTGAVSARAMAATWRSLGFAAAGTLLDTWAAELDALGPAPRATPMLRASRSLDAALHAGRAALDDASAGHEAREVYRWGFLEVDALVSTVFPHGTVLENRLRAGEERAGEVDALFERYAINRFHYFDQPTALPFDIDTFGLLARLASHATAPTEARRLLARPLEWVLENIGPDGDVPVFLTRGVDAGDGRGAIATFGNACVGVQANLLMGLLALPAPRPDDAALRLGAHVAARFAAEGAAALTHYDTLYGATLVLDALAALEAAAPLPGPPGSTRGCARARALDLIARACEAPQPSALALSWRWLATEHSSARSLRQKHWLAGLLRAQAADGGFPAAPFYRVPSRGNHGETYGSRAMTTSFACLALSRARAEPP